MNYRNDIKNEVIDTDVITDTATSSIDYVELGTVLSYFDYIECRIVEIENQIKCISGLTEIDDITELVSSLSRDLY